MNVAIIGQGRSGRNIHGEFFKAHPDEFKIVAAVDELDFRRKQAKEDYGCDVYADYTELFGRKDIDLVVNASYSECHAPISIDLLNHGFNVICEKPAGRKPEDIDKMMEAAEKNGKMITIFQQSRFSKYFKKIQEVIDSGKLGEIKQISICFNGFARRYDWQTLQCKNAGGLFNTGPHPMDQAVILLDYDGMPQVYSKLGNYTSYGDADDFAKVILTAPNRPLIDIEVISCAAYPTAKYTIRGTQGGLCGDFTEIKWKYFNPNTAPIHTLSKETLRTEDGLPTYCKDKLEWQEEVWKTEKDGLFDSAMLELYRNVAAHLENGEPLQVSMKQVRQQIAIIDECHRQNPLPKLF